MLKCYTLFTLLFLLCLYELWAWLTVSYLQTTWPAHGFVSCRQLDADAACLSVSVCRRWSDYLREVRSGRTSSSPTPGDVGGRRRHDGRLRDAPDGRRSRLGGRIHRPATVDTCRPRSTLTLATTTPVRRHLGGSRQRLCALNNNAAQQSVTIRGFTRAQRISFR